MADKQWWEDELDSDGTPEPQEKATLGVTAPAPLPKVKAESLTVADSVPNQITVQLFAHLYDTEGNGTFTGSVPEVLQFLGKMHPLPVKPNDAPKYHKTKAQAPMFNVAVYDSNTPPNANRSDGTWQRSYWGVVGDADAMTREELAQFEATLQGKGWLYLKTTSFKHTEEAPRQRYTLPFDVPVSADEYRTAWSGLNAMAGGKLDDEASDPTRRSYFPSCPQGEETARPPADIRGTKFVTLVELSQLAPGGDAPPLSRRTDWGVDDLDINADIEPQYDDTPADFELIKAECEAMRWAADPENQARVDDPQVGYRYWRGVLGIVKFCTGADELAHEVSRHSPKYDRRETQRKLEGWNKGPTKCATFAEFNSDACGRCKHRGKVTSPIQTAKVTAANLKTDAGTVALTDAIESGALHTIVDQNGVLNYVETFQKDGRTCRSVFAASSQEATDLILSTVSTANGKPPSQQAIATAEARLRSAARRSGVTTMVHLRVAQVGEVRYHDLRPGRIVRIDTSGWGMVDESGDVPLFRRGSGAGELPDPEPFAGGAPEALAFGIKHYHDLFKMPPNRAIIAMAVFLDRLDPNTPHPILERLGPAGSGKSTVTEHDVNLIDPPLGNGLRTTRLREEDIGAAAQQQYALSIDNARSLEQGASDTLCIASTGGTITARMFHEQTKVVSLNIHRPPYITGVNPVAREPDLMTRIIREEYGPIDGGADVIGEEDMRALMRARRPALLGALYTLKVEALRALPEVRQRKGWKHRMVTFDQGGEAMLTAAGYAPGAFQKIIGDVREAMARRNASGDTFLLTVCAALRRVQEWDKDAEEPTFREVLQRPRPAALFDIAQSVCAVMRPSVLLALLPRPDVWEKNPAIPRTERALMDALRRVQPTLRTIGILYREATYGTRQMLRFEWRPIDLEDAGGNL